MMIKKMTAATVLADVDDLLASRPLTTWRLDSVFVVGVATVAKAAAAPV